MDATDYGFVAVHRSVTASACDELRTVLAAAGIDSEVVPAGRAWLLLVRAEEAIRASREIAGYGGERAGEAPPPAPAAAPLPGAPLGAVVYATVLSVVGLLSRSFLPGADWVGAGAMRAGALLGGEWWRAVTALTLHVDGGHLLANSIFGAVLGLFAGQALGGGVAWLAILLAGALGNVLDAAAQPPEHTAIGASTAVFATLGLLVTHAIRGRGFAGQGPLRRFSPLVAGALLLAWTGIGGERTDVLAHVAGFASGAAVGIATSLLPPARLDHRGVQLAAGGLALALLAASWAAAL